jgi:hypothetical protein
MKRILVWTVAILAVATIYSHIAVASGNSPAQLSRAGWLCVNAGPDNYVHCFPPGAMAATASLSVKVFETTDVNATSAHFLGTELLIRADLYEGQPCAQNGHEYELLPSSASGLPADYRACHHYATSH